MRRSLSIPTVFVACLLCAVPSGMLAADSPATSPEWTSTFDVDRANLTNVGTNPYFIPLEPGYRLILKGDGATLTVTVTDKTKLVDGVPTRVVEEREEKNGKPTEISQNYFAIDKTTKTVYYFGEDVDIYKDGKVVSHEGAWLSDIHGAKFGMMMPGRPKVGDRFQQEVAPKVAMDRCEIAAIGEEVETPAGKFKNCLRTKEGSALEKGTSEKVYAPGVGLIKDDEFMLVKIEKQAEKKEAAAVTPASSSQKRPTKIWNRTGPLGETPKRTTDAYPLSDQENKGGWVKFEPMSDEFEGKELDRNKWHVGMEHWRGRQPALFSERNVTVSDGKLHLTMRKEKLPPEIEKLGYKDYTSAALHTKTRSSYGYYEVKAKPMNSGGSSSFWFSESDTPGWATEIDVFEIGGKAKGFERKYNMTLHVWRTPQEKKHWQVGSAWIAPWRLADDYHVYGFDWSKDELKFYVDGVLVRSVENTHWHQPLYLIFDSETMPEWMGMPDDKDLPSTFSVEYVRTWKKQGVPPSKTPSGEAILTFPKIDRHPAAPAGKSVPSVVNPPGSNKKSPIPRFDSKSPWTAFQVDLRNKDLSKLDLRGSLENLRYASFDTRTVWPSAERMPKEFDRQRILEMGKNPGLGVRRLHARGITGRGVGLAIIDQPLLVEHQEYKDRLRLYEEIHVTPDPNASMHGAAGASIAVGKTIGVAPEADLYYIGSWHLDYWGLGVSTSNFRYLAPGVRRVLQINKQLPTDRKIRVIAMMIGWEKFQLGYGEITAACKEAKDAGVLVVSSSIEETHGFKFNGLGRSPLADPDRFESYEPGLFWSVKFPEARWLAGRLLIPMDSRTTACYLGANEYFFCRQGGWSWSIPYIAGVYALTCQVDPQITPDRFWDLAVKTGRTIRLKHDGKDVPFGPILDPVALVDATVIPKSKEGSAN